MTGPLPVNRAARHSFLTGLLDPTSPVFRPIATQSQLRELLIAAGFEVTQATVSRDLEELRAHKVRQAGGDYAYVVGNEVVREATPGSDGAEQPSVRLARMLPELLVSARAAANLVVLRTPPGGAQHLASLIDNSIFPDMIGTVAGDDTVLIITQSDGQALVTYLLELSERR